MPSPPPAPGCCGRDRHRTPRRPEYRRTRMIPRTADTVRLGASPASKDEAVRDAADLLVAAGGIDPGYAETMRGRAKAANTYLGEGIASCHGLLKDRDLIRVTGMSVMQVPGGLEW